MSSSYGVDAFIQGMPGLALLALPILVGFLNGAAGRRLMACLPGIVGIVGFAAACAASPYTSKNSTLVQYSFLALSCLALFAIAPAILALRNRWLGCFHLMTLVGLVFLYFVGGMAISHDWL